MTVQAILPSVTEPTEDSATCNNVIGVGRLWDPARHVSCWSFDRDVSHMFQLWRTALPIWLADMAAVGVSVGLSAIVFQLSGGIPANLNLMHIVGWCLALTGGCALSGLYPSTGMNSATELRLISRVIAAGVTLCVAYDWVHGGSNKYLMLWPLYGLSMSLLVPLSRALVRQLVCRFDWWGLQVIVIGAGDRGLELVRQMKRRPNLGFKPAAIVDRYRPDWILNDEDLPKSGVCSIEDTPELSVQHQAFCGIFVGSEFPESQRSRMIDTLTSVFPLLYITVDSADAGRQWSGVIELGNMRLLGVTEQMLMPGSRWIKRAVDVTAILLAAPFIVPLVFCLAVIVKHTSPGPAFYLAPRIGRHGRTIHIWKLRTMMPNAAQLLNKYLAENPELRSDWDRLNKLPNDPRITPFGKFLRKWSLDELPQLWNVLRGEMSLVGPRPIQPNEISKYESIYLLYIRAKPGITGLWQVNGRSSTTYEARLSFEEEYVRNWSVFLDFYILAKTIRAVLSCEGAC